ncbi:PREDICTED: protein PML-like, partial [Apaloderma vittatum]|uniref:protein PML-like n=1 Tax=Apaloderma vittatum TaxID=57397 RepID=UPI0005218BE3
LLEKDFQFILCEGCRQESPNLKLLSCLHTLCLGCLSENKPVTQCPVCQTSIPQANGIPHMDNLLFTNLRVRLKVYEKIVDGVNLSCDNCKKGVEFWCSECEEFLCAKCFEAHQHYLKRERHEPKRVMDIRAGSAKDFLEGAKRTGNLSCSNLTHKGQTVSIYCKKCCKPMCCICAVLDGQHAPFCDIRGETQRRQEELATINQELRQKRSILEATFALLQDEAARLEEAQREMRELIRQRVEQLSVMFPQMARDMHNFPFEDEATVILNLEPPREHCQPREGLPTGLLAHHQLCRPMSDPSDGRGHEDFGGWARSNVQQADELLEVGSRLLQAQHRANRRLILVTQEIQAMSRTLATIASAVGPLLQPGASSQDFHTADVNWPSLPSDLLQLFPPSTSQIPGASTDPSPCRTPPAPRSASPARSEPSSPSSEGEYPKSKPSTKGKRGGKPSTRLRKRRKK